MKSFKIFVPTDGLDGAIRVTYEGEVHLQLKAESSWSLSSDILSDSRLNLNLGKVAPIGDLHRKSYMVTVEELNGPAEGEHKREYYARVVAEKEEQELTNAGISPSISRRLRVAR